ncbi:hypothetical protein NIES267_29560 [Calothrix parasitica NIES-267]|uniref:Uncharacterized protein n=1 Tax=Calothrix parasitica NIES-267 TaxID=1973488 RepID=A0A1Z4LQH6_9CYAN|nr:hypothetical protein NIES267_29560 [Calothrix parasitica NIES-267]
MKTAESAEQAEEESIENYSVKNKIDVYPSYLIWWSNSSPFHKILRGRVFCGTVGRGYL